MHWADPGGRGGDGGGGRGVEEAGCYRTGGCRSRNAVFSFQLLGREVNGGGGPLFWLNGVREKKKCHRSRQWGTRSSVCRWPPLQHQHGAGEHRSQHRAAESSGRWGWRWRGWQLLSALTAPLCRGGMMRYTRAHISHSVSPLSRLNLSGEEDFTPECAPVWSRQSHTANSI